MFHLVTWQRFRKTGRPERSWHRFSNEFPCHWCRLTGCFSNTIRAGSKNKLELRAVHLISSPAGRPAPVPGPLNSGTSGRGPVFAGTPGRSAPSGSPPAPLKAPAFVRPRQMHYLHYSQAKAPPPHPVPFASEEVALHALMNNKREAQRVGNGGRKERYMKRSPVAQHEGEHGPLIWPRRTRVHRQGLNAS